MANISNYNNFAIWADSDTDQKVEITDNSFKGSTSNGDYVISGVQNTFYNQLSLVTVSLAQAISAPGWQPNLDFANYSNSFKNAFNNAIATKMETDGTSAFATNIGNSTAHLNYSDLKPRVDMVDAMKQSFYLISQPNVTFNGGDITIYDTIENVATRKANGYANAVLELVVSDPRIVTSGLYIYSATIGDAPYNGTIVIKALNGMPNDNSDITIKIKVSDYSFRSE